MKIEFPYWRGKFWIIEKISLLKKIEFPYWRGKFENYKKLFTVYNYFLREE